MRKQPVIKFYPTKQPFNYGQCATKAITQAFDLTENSFLVIARMLRLEPGNGLDFWESSRVINTISRHLRIDTEYVPNSSKVEYGQLLVVLTDKRLITMFDEHLSYATGGKVFDDYFYKIFMLPPW